MFSSPTCGGEENRILISIQEGREQRHGNFPWGCSLVRCWRGEGRRAPKAVSLEDRFIRAPPTLGVRHRRRCSIELVHDPSFFSIQRTEHLKNNLSCYRYPLRLQSQTSRWMGRVSGGTLPARRWFRLPAAEYGPTCLEPDSPRCASFRHSGVRPSPELAARCRIWGEAHTCLPSRRRRLLQLEQGTVR